SEPHDYAVGKLDFQVPRKPKAERRAAADPGRPGQRVANRRPRPAAPRRPEPQAPAGSAGRIRRQDAGAIRRPHCRQLRQPGR
nr:hypothetical protein [Tanacetum cinerariifolium]